MPLPSGAAGARPDCFIWATAHFLPPSGKSSTGAVPPFNLRLPKIIGDILPLTLKKRLKPGKTRQIGEGEASAQQPKQNDAPNHAAEISSLAPAIAIPQDVARAKCSRASNSVEREPAVIRAGMLLVDLDSTGCGWPSCLSVAF
jgi:hypothetical protein